MISFSVPPSLLKLGRLTKQGRLQTRKKKNSNSPLLTKNKKHRWAFFFENIYVLFFIYFLRCLFNSLFLYHSPLFILGLLVLNAPFIFFTYLFLEPQRFIYSFIFLHFNIYYIIQQRRNF